MISFIKYLFSFIIYLNIYYTSNFDTQDEILKIHNIQPETYALYRLLVNTGLINSLEKIEIFGRTNINVLQFRQLTAILKINFWKY